MKQELKNPFDSTAEEARLYALEEEIKQASASIENDFAKYVTEQLNEDDDELYFSNKEAFIKKILGFQNDFLAKIATKQNEANALKGEIENKKSMQSIQTAAENFSEKNPDVNIDDLFDFYANDLPPRLRANLDKLEPNAFFEELNKIYNSQQNIQNNNQQDLPKELKGAPTAANETALNEESVTNRY